MCGRFWRDIGWDEYRRGLTVMAPAVPQNYEPHFDVRPTTQALVARPVEGGVELVDMRWGLVPFWHRKPLKDFKLTSFNARSETVATAATFREAFKRRRCLVPARGWYEWTGPKGGKTKWSFRHRSDPFIMFAGLWDRAETPDGPVESFTILTRAPRSCLADWHDREPIVVARGGWDAWLENDTDCAPLIAAVEHDEFAVEQAE